LVGGIRVGKVVGFWRKEKRMMMTMGEESGMEKADVRKKELKSFLGALELLLLSN
jgi:hypothetical protein